MDPAYNLTSLNTTLDDTRQSYLDFIKELSITIYSIIFVLGTIENALVIWIAGFTMKKTISTMWFLHLAIADFLCCLSLLLNITEWVFNSSYVGDLDIFCTLVIFLFYTNMSASVFLLTAISIDRLVSVMWPLWAKTHRTLKIVRVTVAMIWLLSFLSSGLMFYSNRWCLRSRNKSDYEYIQRTKQITRPLRFVVMFVIPSVIIVTSYVTISLKLRKSKRAKRSKRSYRIITAVILCFFICCFPQNVWPLIYMYSENLSQFLTLNTIITTLACLNSCINPIIYIFMGQEFKHGFLKSIPFRLQKVFGEPPTESYRRSSECTNTRD